MSLALVIRLLSLLLGFENAAVIHGSLPNRLAGLPLPRETQVVVSYVRRSSPFSFSAGVRLETTLSPDVFRAQMGWERSGWKPVRLPIPTIEPFPFKPNNSPPPEKGLAGTPFFQKDGMTLTLNSPTARPGRPTRAYFRVESGDRPVKGLLPIKRTGVVAFLPSLTVPKGAEMGAMSAFESNEAISASTGVTTSLSPV